MHEMSDDERRAFLMQGTRTAKVATTRRDGRPHIAPVWFLLDGDTVVFTTHADSVKGRTIARDPRVSLLIDEEKPPFAFVMVEGTAETSDDLDAMLSAATRIGARYMGPDEAEEFGRRNAVPGELLVRVTPTKIVARGGITD